MASQAYPALPPLANAAANAGIASAANVAQGDAVDYAAVEAAANETISRKRRREWFNDVTGAEVAEAAAREQALRAEQASAHYPGVPGNVPQQLQAIQQQLLAIQQQLQQLPAIQQQLQQLPPQLHNLDVKRQNSLAVAANGAIAPLQDLQGNIPQQFPATRQGLLQLNGAAANQLIGFYGLVQGGTVPNRIARIATHIGLQGV